MNDVEMLCPLCGKPVRSDADLGIGCKLCGMGISVGKEAVVYGGRDGEILHFCCDRCLRIYLERVSSVSGM